jgi:hypothetical protein
MIELITFSGALAFGTIEFWLFWLVAIVVICLEVGLTETEHQVIAFVLFVLGLWVLAGLGIFNLYRFTLDHPRTLIEDVIGYIVCGVVWGTVKWFRFCRQSRRGYLRHKASYLSESGKAEYTPALLAEFHKSWRCSGPNSPTPPNWRKYKEELSTWMALWPFSLLGTFCSDLLFRFWKNLTRWMGGIYDDISKRVWAGIDDASLAEHKE